MQLHSRPGTVVPLSAQNHSELDCQEGSLTSLHLRQGLLDHRNCPLWSGRLKRRRSELSKYSLYPLSGV